MSASTGDRQPCTDPTCLGVWLVDQPHFHSAPTKPAAASTGDWWHNAIEAGARVRWEAQHDRTKFLYGWHDMVPGAREKYRQEFAAALAAVLPLFVAEATRRIKSLQGEYQTANWNDALTEAATVLAGLAGEVGQHD